MLLLAGLFVMVGPQSISGPDTYPPEALKRHQEGKVVTSLRVGTDGRVVSCAIKQSSGSPWLDEDACKKIVARARFRPAQDSAGKPIEGDAEIPLMYELPR